MAFASINTGQVNLNGATRIVKQDVNRAQVQIVNTGSTDVWLGYDSTVTSTTGHLLLGTKGTSITIPGGSEVWGIPTSGAVTVTYMETRQG